MIARGSRRGRARAIALMAALGLVGAVFAGTMSAAGAQSSSKVLGTKDAAKGTPVKVGVISNGKTPTVDQSLETPVAQATAQWINQYQGGLGGHPIDLDICDDHGTAGEATDCANKMIQDKVAAVVIGQESQLEAIWTALHTSGIPVYLYGASNPAVVADPNTFVFTNGHATLLGLPAGVAKKNKSKKVSIVAIDVPAATAFFKDPGPSLYQKEGLELELIPIAAGTADMTPQMAKLVQGNPKGTVFIIGNDAFCIAALNGLRTANFQGQITSIPQCLTDATRTAVPADFLAGMNIAATAPIENPKDPSMKQYYAVLDKFGASSVDKSNIGGVAMFTALGGFSAATHGLKADPTPAAVSDATKKMDWVVLPGTGGLHFRCNSKADATQPAVCSNGVLAATLNAQGNATKYIPVGDNQIPAA